MNMMMKLLGAAFFILHSSFFVSCSDFFDQESDHVLYDNVNHLNNAVDSIYSVTGIMNKMQELADRTILLGEVRGDLVDITSDASADLRELATFSVSDDNQYNQPRDYYAVINNCNYYLAHVDTALKNNRNEYIFMKEYAAVKAFRAWTYLQLVINYGQVPFVTEPILTKEQAERTYPLYSIQDVCQYFIDDLATIPERYNTEYPGYGNILYDSRFYYFPLSIVRGDLYLWLGSATNSKYAYGQAALNYYKYLNERNGQNSNYATELDRCMWELGSTTWQNFQESSYDDIFMSESYSASSELITMIPSNTRRSMGSYSELRNLFTSTSENDYKPSLTPSQAVQDISAAQWYCCLSTNGNTVTYAPQGLTNHRTGDLRLSSVWSEYYRRDPISNEMVEAQSILKYQSYNVHIYRRTMVYLRMAEALNMAGYPRMAFLILSNGINNKVIQDQVIPYYSESDSIFLSQFDFPTRSNGGYVILTKDHLTNPESGGSPNTMGIHTRGSGWTPMNEYYQLPNDTALTVDPQQLVAEQQLAVDSLILNEGALEFAFEGTRYYDLMRFAMRSNNPGALLTKYIYARRGESRRGEVQSEIKVDLSNQRNWFLQWNKQIGLFDD